jgi:hypothetical protein
VDTEMTRSTGPMADLFRWLDLGMPRGREGVGPYGNVHGSFRRSVTLPRGSGPAPAALREWTVRASLLESADATERGRSSCPAASSPRPSGTSMGSGARMPMSGPRRPGRHPGAALVQVPV